MYEGDCGWKQIFRVIDDAVVSPVAVSEGLQFQTVIFQHHCAISCVIKGPGDTQFHFGRAVWKEYKMSSRKPVGIQ